MTKKELSAFLRNESRLLEAQVGDLEKRADVHNPSEAYYLGIRVGYRDALIDAQHWLNQLK